MIYRRFGRTDLQMPVFSCGGMRYQHKWQDVPLSEVPDDNQANLEATIRRAVDLGINHIETARGYGSSERQLGLILPRLPRESIIVQTKVGPKADPDEFTREFEDSLARLQLDHVDLFSLHGINNREVLDLAVKDGGCLRAARRIQQRGLAKHIGFSTHAPTDVILDALRHEGDGGFDYVNLHWYYIFQRNWPAIEEATARDMGVFIISPSDKGGKLYDPPDKLVELCQPLHPIVFNDLFCLSYPQVHTLSIGAARPSDFDLHVETLDLLDRADELLPPIIERLEQTLRDTVGDTLKDPFALGLPEWDEVPGGINLSIILWLYGLARAYGMTDYGQMRYGMLGNAGHWFPGNNAAEADKVDLAAIAQRTGLDDQLVPTLQQAHQMLYKEKVKRLSES